MKSVIFSSPASLELDEAIAHYESRRMGLGMAFLIEIHEIVGRISELPAQFPAWEIEPTFRKAVLPETFPYIAFFEAIGDDTILITAVAHGARKPGYWLDDPSRRS